MRETEKELSKLKGIGKVLAGRLVEAGLDSYDKIVAAGAEGLGRINNINPRAVPAILAQAAELAAAIGAAEEQGAGVRKAAERLRQRVEVLAVLASQGLAGNRSGAKKVEGQIVKLIDLLDRIAAQPERRPKKTGRRLAKADRRLSVLGEPSATDLARRLKKSRRKLRKVVA